MCKLLKFFLIIMFIIVTLGCGIWYVYLPWAFFSSRQLSTDLTFQYLIATALKIPHVDKKPEMIKDSLEDLEEISYDEWMNMECNCPDTISYGYYTGGDGEILDIRTQKHLRCITPYARNKHYNTLEPNSSRIVTDSSIFNSSSIIIFIPEYVLKYSKVFNNLIKIAEKPCFYIKGLDQDDKFHETKYARSYLYCDHTKWMFYEKDKIFSEIIIIDSSGNAKMKIIIERKDNVHLMK